jgi:broad specificity phosphatase PhoE
MMRLLLIRHGQTPSNVRGALDTRVPGPRLTRLGRRQAAAIPTELAGERIGAVYASVQTRAQLTAAPLSRALALPVLVRVGLREISAGTLEMNIDAASVHQYHSISFGWSAGQVEERMPGGENGVEVLGRFDEVVDEMASAGIATVACVAHGQIIRTWVAARSANVDADFALKHVLHNTGVVALEGSPAAGWTTVSWTGIALGGVRVDEGAQTGPGGEAD